MKICSKCGKELFDETVICPGCGCPVSSEELHKLRTSTASKTEGSYPLGLMIALLGIAVSVAASFLTLFHLGKIAEMTAMDGDFKIGSLVTFAILAVVLVTLIMRDGGVKGYCFVGGIAVLGEALIHYLYVTQRLSKINVLWINLGDAVKMDIGFYSMLLGGGLVIISGFFMPAFTKKRGAMIMTVVVGALILAGVIVTYLVNGGAKKDESTAKSDDVSFIIDVMYKAEVVALDWQLNVTAGTSFTISFNNGKVTLSCSNYEAQNSWESEVSDLSHPLELESSTFGEINGSIIGKMQKDGSMTWIGNGVSALTIYSSQLSKMLSK